MDGRAAQCGADRELAAGVQLLPSRDSEGAASLLSSRFTSDRRPDRVAGHRRADHSPSAVERLARHRAGAPVRAGGREAMTCFDEGPMTFGYARYLAAETTLDARALHRHVQAQLCQLMPA